MSALNLKNRDNTKPNAMRNAGWIPVGYVIRGEATRTLKATEADIIKAMAGAKGAGMITVNLEGETKTRNAVVKQVQKNLMQKHIQTIVLMDLNLNETITVDVPIHHVGTPAAVLAAEATVVHPNLQIQVRGRAGDLPNHIEVDISHLEVGHHITAAEVELPKGMELASSPDAILFIVKVLRAVVLEETHAETPAEPALIGESSESAE
jgi:large subunit ribosomal protein L25